MKVSKYNFKQVQSLYPKSKHFLNLKNINDFSGLPAPVRSLSWWYNRVVERGWQIDTSLTFSLSFWSCFCSFFVLLLVCLSFSRTSTSCRSSWVNFSFWLSMNLVSLFSFLQSTQTHNAADVYTHTDRETWETCLTSPQSSAPRSSASCCLSAHCSSHPDLWCPLESGVSPLL